MIKNNFNTQAYKAPVCKLVRVQVQGLVCTSPGVDGIADIEGEDVVEQNESWGF